MQTYAPQLRELTLSYRVRRTIQGDAIRFGGSLTDEDAAARILRSILADEPSEVFGMLCVSVRQRLIGYHEVSRGRLVASNLHPRDVYRAAVLANAAGVILVHYRLSGDPAPNEHDVAVGRRLASAGDTLGIPVLAYLVIANDRHVGLGATDLM